MVVDDEIDIARLFQLYLENSGYHVDIYTDPLKALSAFKFGKYDLVLLDIRMPGMNGFELYQKLKHLDLNCKFCFITGFQIYYESLKEFFPTVDITCYIQKPATREKLLDKIEKELVL